VSISAARTLKRNFLIDCAKIFFIEKAPSQEVPERDDVSLQRGRPNRRGGRGGSKSPQHQLPLLRGHPGRLGTPSTYV